MTSVAGIGVYVPEQRLTLSELSQWIHIPESERIRFTDLYGLSKMAIESSLSIPQMMIQATKRLLDRFPTHANSINMILLTHTFNPVFPYMYDPISELREMYEWDNPLVCSSSQLNCASIEHLMFLGRKWLQKHCHIETILLLAVDKLFVPELRYLKGSTLSGDSAAAVLLTKSENYNKVVSSYVRSDAVIFNSIQASDEDYEWFQHTFILGIVKVIRTTLSQSGLHPEDLKYMFVSNINGYLWKKVAELTGINHEIFYFHTMAEVGHLQNADCLLNWSDAWEGGLLEPGDYFATLSVGIGGSYGCNIFQY